MGRCAPDAETIKTGRSDSLRARAILRSLVSMEDLEGVLGLRFILPVSKGEVNELGKKSLHNLSLGQLICCNLLLWGVNTSNNI